MDPRLRTAIGASHAWYADVFALHGLATATHDGLWRTLAPPPPLHSAAKTLVPGVREADVVAAVAAYDRCSVADSFGDLELDGHGFDVLIDATWLLHDALEPASLPGRWERVDDTSTLAAWVDLHGTAGVFPDAVLEHPAFTVLARRGGGSLTGGAVVHAGPAAVTVAHTFTTPGHELPVTEWLVLAAALHPGRPVADYAGEVALEEALDAGFVALGPQLVWAR